MTSRIVHHGEALSWLAQNPAQAGMSVVTSMPDFSETPHQNIEEWKQWFGLAASTILRWLPARGLAVFYQSDIRQDGVWIDKGYLVQRAAEAQGAVLVWHKIACRKPPGTLGKGRPTYAHILCFAKGATYTLREPGPDVLPDTGEMTFSRGTGAIAAQTVCNYLKADTETNTVVDPFCGEGMILRAANRAGMHAIGVELSESRAKKAAAS
jgi:hypothetical protein